MNVSIDRHSTARLARHAVLSAALCAALSGTAGASVLVQNTTQFNSGFAVSATDLLQTHLASTTLSNAVSREGEQGLLALTDGAFGGQGNQGGGGGAATMDASNVLTYQLDLGNGAGWDIQSISSYAGWDAYRGGQSYTVAYATVFAPTVYIDLATEFNDATGSGVGNVDTRAVISSSTGVLAQNVASLRFTFGSNLQAGYAGDREIDVLGGASVPEPSTLLLGLLALGGVVLSRRRR